MSKVETIVEYYHNQLKLYDVAKAYAKLRGLTKETILKFKIGYAPAHPLYAPRFRDRLIFPIWDAQGNLVGWTGRTLVNSPSKYMNVKESAIFKKNRLLYAYNFAVESIYNTQAAILCEGQMDAVMLHQVGIHNTVASSGTSSFKTAAACLLSRYARRVYLVFDADDPGKTAMLGAEKHLHDLGVNDVIRVELPEKEDPASFVLKYGKNEFLGLLHDAKQQRKAT